MTALNPVRNIIQQEETRFEAAVSEGTLGRVGETLNLISLRQCNQADFNLNGKYNIIATPFYFGDGYITYPFPWEIVDVLLFTGENTGSSGTSEFDIKWIAEAGVSYASICSTTPKYTSSAPVNRMCRIGATPPAGMTSAVLSKTQFDAYDIVKLDVLQAVAGSVNGAYIKIFTRPR